MMGDSLPLKDAMPLAREAIAICQRILLELWRRRHAPILWTVFPVTLLVLNGLVLAEGMKLERQAAFEIAAPSTLAGAALFFSCTGGSIASIVAERESRTLRRLFLAPIRSVSYFLGMLAAYGCVGLGQTLLVYAVAAGFGVRFQGEWWLGAGILALSIAAYVGVGFWLATQFARSTEDVNSLVAGCGVPLLILGGAFFPSSFLSRDLLLVAQFNPIYHINEAFLAVSADGKTLGDPDVALHVRFLCGFFAIAIAVGWLSYRRMLAAERRL